MEVLTWGTSSINRRLQEGLYPSTGVEHWTQHTDSEEVKAYQAGVWMEFYVMVDFWFGKYRKYGISFLGTVPTVSSASEGLMLVPCC